MVYSFYYNMEFGPILPLSLVFLLILFPIFTPLFLHSFASSILFPSFFSPLVHVGVCDCLCEHVYMYIFYLPGQNLGFIPELYVCQSLAYFT